MLKNLTISIILSIKTSIEALAVKLCPNGEIKHEIWGDFIIGSAPPHDPIDIFVANPSFFPGLPQNLCHVRLAGGHCALTLLHVRMLFLINGA